MSKQTINIGASPNDGTGTPLRTSFDYTNQNFTEIYTALGGGVALPGATTQVIFNDGGTNLAGDAGLVYNKTTDALTVAGLVTAGSATITGDLTVDTSTLKVDATNDRVGIKTATPRSGFALDVLGNVAIGDSTTTGSYPLVIDSLGTAGTVASIRFKAANVAKAYFGLSGSFLGDTSTDAMVATDAAGAGIRFYVADTAVEVARFNSTGNLAFANTKGIDFAATASGSGTMTSELLNDYEEGTFTPTVEGNTAAGTLTAPVRYGYYTKVGSLVTVQVYLGWTNLVGATGYMILGGLPFAASSSTNILSAVSFAYVNYIALTAGNVLNGLINPGTSYVELGQYPTGGGANTTVPIDTAGSIIYTATYRV